MIDEPRDEIGIVVLRSEMQKSLPRIDFDGGSFDIRSFFLLLLFLVAAVDAVSIREGSRRRAWRRDDRFGRQGKESSREFDITRSDVFLPDEFLDEGRLVVASSLESVRSILLRFADEIGRLFQCGRFVVENFLLSCGVLGVSSLLSFEDVCSACGISGESRKK